MDFEQLFSKTELCEAWLLNCLWHVKPSQCHFHWKLRQRLRTGSVIQASSEEISSDDFDLWPVCMHTTRCHYYHLNLDHQRTGVFSLQITSNISANTTVKVKWQVAGYSVTPSIWGDLDMTPELQMSRLKDFRSERMLRTSLCPAVGIVLIHAPDLSLRLLMNDVFKDAALPELTSHYYTTLYLENSNYTGLIKEHFDRYSS